ncbi:Nitrilase [compost metagenome]
MNPGDAVVYKPFGGMVAGPMHQEKGLLITELDVAAVQASRRKFDVSGHYARPDVFQLHVNRTAMRPVDFTN